MEMVQFNKDIGLAGACLMLFALFAAFAGEAGLDLMITDPVFTNLW